MCGVERVEHVCVVWNVCACVARSVCACVAGSMCACVARSMECVCVCDMCVCV